MDHEKRVQRYGLARRLLEVLYEAYLEHGSHNATFVFDEEAGDSASFGVPREDLWRAGQMLQVKRLAAWRGQRAIYITREGIAAVEAPATLDELLPVRLSRAESEPLLPDDPEALERLRIELAFVKTEALREMLLRDLNELREAMASGLIKSTMLLCGSLLEAILLDVVGRRPDLAQAEVQRSKKWPDGFSARDFLGIAVRHGMLPESTTRLAESVVEHRDLIHPVAERRGAATVNRPRALAMLAFLGVVAHDLAAAAADGQIERYVTQ